jgi:putative spermidine/putrescine transport system ATP-binding protein
MPGPGTLAQRWTAQGKILVGRFPDSEPCGLFHRYTSHLPLNVSCRQNPAAGAGGMAVFLELFEMTLAVQFSGVSRLFGSITAVDRVSIDIEDGEFFSMLGPSGSGKTTCLRLIAGFEQPSTGSIRIHGAETIGLAPYQRDVNTVFQDYALFPHMNVLDNVAYGLKVKGIGKRERHSRAEEALEMVALGGYGERKPAQLSGGQRQRVALARALVNRPRVLLLDEPLGALDLKLREQMQGELKKLQRQLGITFIFVTHDQTEALSMSDRVAVFNKGAIEQVDTPRNLYMKPATAFVAEFVGTSNVLRGELAKRLTGSEQPFSIRPEHIRFADDQAAASGEVEISGLLHDIQYQGAATRYEIQLENGQSLSISQANDQWQEATPAHQPGQRVTARWARHAMIALREDLPHKGR